MRDLNKTRFVHVNLSQEQMARLEEAAARVSQQRGETVRPTSLAREYIMAGVEATRNEPTTSAAA